MKMVEASAEMRHSRSEDDVLKILGVKSKCFIRQFHCVGREGFAA